MDPKGKCAIVTGGASGLGKATVLRFVDQGAKVVAIPSVLSGLVVIVLAIIAGLMRCAGFGWIDNALQLFQELVGALPRLVVILVVAVAMPPDYRSLIPIGLTWAVLSAPGIGTSCATIGPTPTKPSTALAKTARRNRLLISSLRWRGRGSPRRPSIEAISAVSSPQTKAPAPSLICS